MKIQQQQQKLYCDVMQFNCLHVDGRMGWLNARVMKLQVMVILGVWIAQVMEIACKVHHMDCAGNGIGM